MGFEFSACTVVFGAFLPERKTAKTVFSRSHTQNLVWHPGGTDNCSLEVLRTQRPSYLQLVLVA